MSIPESPAHKESDEAALYPIQPVFVAVRELFIDAPTIPDSRASVDVEEFVLTTGHTAYDEERRIIEVGAQVEFGIETKPDIAYPFSLRVRLLARFKIDESFDKEKISLWARVNAPYTLYPFLREQVFSLTARCGFNPVILPLLMLPTLKVDPTQMVVSRIKASQPKAPAG